MKKALIGSIFLLLVFLFGTSSAVELNVFGPQKYVRTKGKPDVYTDTFQSRQGSAKIQIINGNEDGTHRISSARIIFNGAEIFGPRDFNPPRTRRDRLLQPPR